jgi:CRP-like cAMP-binding protein
VEFFRGRKACEFDEIAMAVQYKFVPAGEKVFEMGQEGELFYILLEGHADVIKPFLSKETIKKIVGKDGQVIR